MNIWNIPVNIDVSAETEERAEEIVASIFKPIMAKPVLERSVINWDFIEFVEGDEVDDEST